MKVFEVEVSGKDGIITISQSDVYDDGCSSISITIDQLELFKSMLDDAVRESISNSKQ
jgi:hypothetical protein